MFSTGTQENIDRARRHGLGDLLTRSARRVPGRTAVIDGDHRFTYAEFDEVVGRLAQGLALRGVTSGDRIAVLSHNCWQYGALSFALAKLGAIMVPINFMLNVGEVTYILGDAEVTGVVVEDALHLVMRDAVTESGIDCTVRGWISLVGDEPAAGWEDLDVIAAETPDAEPEVAVGDDDPLRLMYTSGTESRPKGVMLSSRSLITQYQSCIVDGGMTADDIEVHALPLYHVRNSTASSPPTSTSGRPA